MSETPNNPKRETLDAILWADGTTTRRDETGEIETVPTPEPKAAAGLAWAIVLDADGAKFFGN